MSSKEKIVVLTDSASDLPYSMEEDGLLRIVPLYIMTKEKAYRDGIDLTAEECYDMMENEIPTTSMPNIGSVLEILEDWNLEPDVKILAITVSSGLSGTINVFREVKERIANEMHIIDSKNIACGEGFLSQYALDLIKEGCTFEEIIEKVEEAVKRSKVFYYIDTLKYLKAGGRIGRVSGTIGDIFNIKPIISCDDNGIYYNVKKIRGKKRALKEIVEIARKSLGDKKKYYLSVCHGNAPEEGEIMKARIQDIIDGAHSFLYGQISPVLGVHTGPGLMGIGFLSFE